MERVGWGGVGVWVVFFAGFSWFFVVLLLVFVVFFLWKEWGGVGWVEVWDEFCWFLFGLAGW